MTFVTMDTIVQRDVHTAVTTWKGKMHFESLVNDHIVHMDKMVKHGGDDTGPRPKPLLLTAIGGCTGMEIMVIFDKMRIKIDAFEIHVEGELNDGTPKTYKSVQIIFSIKCNDDDREKIQRAIDLATEKYCGVLAMVRKFAEVSIETSFSQ